MGDLTRFGVSLHAGLLAQFDQALTRKGYGNRSQAIRDLIRDMLLHDQWHVGGEDVVATVTLVYGSSAHKLASTLTDLQHSHYGKIASTLHVHLDEEDCLEVLILRGEGRALKVLAERLIGTPGVKHGAYSATARENVCAAVVPPSVTERPFDRELHLAETAEVADWTSARIHGVLSSGP